ncbi:hypothetical protein BO94DRAFT_585142 [Aspergillus sclerotioniger CBS 115572]|uniref:Uncharacterized protein n=1 Tax=Aspergillus sclerotioniger CBS 115572 TaxID=1450535 RepID=A0A317WSP8_9EURO|nr:hypothetical protein BO94DRAFT_585142 [Aspergillus sclerotioniger CBS 115572]PWY88771.1 hypothetical protein BO94DRAFT_585142 [Aspergillus sclerotioniger CBS 115572]
MGYTTLKRTMDWYFVPLDLAAGDVTNPSIEDANGIVMQVVYCERRPITNRSPKSRRTNVFSQLAGGLSLPQQVRRTWDAQYWMIEAWLVASYN